MIKKIHHLVAFLTLSLQGNQLSWLPVLHCMHSMQINVVLHFSAKD